MHGGCTIYLEKDIFHVSLVVTGCLEYCFYSYVLWFAKINPIESHARSFLEDIEMEKNLDNSLNKFLLLCI